MATPIGFYPILGLNLLAWIGMIGFLFLVIAAYVGFMAIKGKPGMTMKKHKTLALIAILLGLVHLIFFVLSKFGI